MSRDGGERTDEQTDELLAAYVDGVAEISPDDRRLLEARLARDPQARADEAAVRALLGRLRSAAPGRHDAGDASEPDWAAMERAIHDAVGAEVPRPWWRWTWLVPGAALATAAAVALAIWARPAQPAAPSAPPLAREATRAPSPVDVVALWLDGAEVDVDLAALPGAGPSSELSDDAVAGPGAELEAELDVGVDMVRLLPTNDLAWIDRLDDDALERAETWLAGKG